MSQGIDRHQAQLIIIGAGPAGLTAAMDSMAYGVSPLVVEASNDVGGISRTVVRNGWRFDLGGHRFFTKVERVQQFWEAALKPGDFLTRPRLSRIYFDGKFFDYPLKASNALANLGPIEALRCVISYISARLRPPKDQSTFEGWVTARFGSRLYNKFFKTYTEKVWGIPGTALQASWAAQRIKNLSLGKAVVSALSRKGRKASGVVSLIEEFQYPRLGPGMLWEACADVLRSQGSPVQFGFKVEAIKRVDAHTVAVRSSCGTTYETRGGIISSMPINELVRAIEGCPNSVLSAADRLRHRDFLTVALPIHARHGFPDNWIYIHDPSVRVGRIQNFGSWSPHMVKPGYTCLGLEYFVSEGDDLWSLDDPDLVQLGIDELTKLSLVPPGKIDEGYVVRVPKAYPVYDANYAPSLASIKAYLEANWPEIQCVGRNGMHRYNNQDHSMLTAMLAVENLLAGQSHDLWSVNVDEEYHEEASASPTGTGRSAPIVPTA